MSLAYGDTAGSLINRREFLGVLGIDCAALVCADQVHGSAASFVSLNDKGRGALDAKAAIRATDALVTNIDNLPLAIFTADCLSIFFYDPAYKVIGLAHAGWRGTKDKIALKTVQLMQDKFASKAQDILAGFGPALKSCCYEVGREFHGYFSSGLHQRGKRLYLDLPGINKNQLLSAGILEKNIFDPGHCTHCRSDLYFSYRRDNKAAGRMMSVMMMR